MRGWPGGLVLVVGVEVVELALAALP